MLVGTKISKNYVFELASLYKYRDFKDGITILEFKLNHDLYIADHNPKFEFAFSICNFVIIYITIYNINHVDKENSTAIYKDTSDEAIIEIMKKLRSDLKKDNI